MAGVKTGIGRPQASFRHDQQVLAFLARCRFWISREQTMQMSAGFTGPGKSLLQSTILSPCLEVMVVHSAIIHEHLGQETSS